MGKIKQKIIVMLGLSFLCFSVFSDETKKLEEEKFSIKIDDRKNYPRATLRVGSIQIETTSRAGFFTIKTAGKQPYSFRTYHGKDDAGKSIVPGLNAYSIVEIIDEKKIKSVEVNSSLFENKGIVQQLRSKLTIRRNFPGVFVKSSVINLSDEKSDCYFCWFMPMPSEKYINSEGIYNPPKMYAKVKFKDWIYLPGNEKKQGYALFMNNDLPGIKFFTNQKERGIRGSWGIMSYGLWFNKNEGNSIDFVVFPANNAEEVKREYKLKNKE